ncbi:hypothetical protein [Ureibacillus chungkukjangi]|uniref:Uncharacterized protein n=1 Tax=Ureibacillus chungkukjangi TaxID=1202712 RepID=A0A318TL86_9BACL|nr:hypothetical protein [Ureibacillus chungkukjangi]PYF05203.1 hypothetical protein BJ095_11821 [Ureibacillus chungkukjangi]
MLTRDADTEAYINTLENGHIYKDIRAKYGELTDDGRNYKHEYNEIVIRYACEKYNLTTEQLDRIFIDSEIKISEYERSRVKPNN